MKPTSQVFKFPESGSLGLTPHGILVAFDANGTSQESGSEGELLMSLGAQTAVAGADPTFSFWRSIAHHLIRAVCQLPDARHLPSLPKPTLFMEWTLNAPPMRGGEYLSPEVLQAIWERLEAWTAACVGEQDGIAAFLAHYAPAWSRVGRVTLHLAENKDDAEFPFAFMATYASGISHSGNLTQVPLGRALKEYSGDKNKPALLKLLTPLHKAAQSSPHMRDLVDSGDIFHPLVWNPAEAYQLLQSIPVLEEAGLLVRLPNWWKKKGKRPAVTATIGGKKEGALGLDALLDFQLNVELDGRTLTPEELEALMQGGDGLVLFRGEWIEVDRDRLQQAMDHWKSIETGGGVSFIEGMRLLAGAPGDLGAKEDIEEHREWAFAKPGKWLSEILAQLSSPDAQPVPPALRATLRPYQTIGLNWLWFCASGGLGACLADDMGLGKTVQVLAALLRKQEQRPDAPPSLLVVPASLIGNWKREAASFAPSLRLYVAHRSETLGEIPTKPAMTARDQPDLVITTYGTLPRLEWLNKVKWGWIIVDEAQAIKNHASRQSKAVRSLEGSARIALTGTPVENHLGDLWSLFDFINPGLLGSSGEFQRFVKNLRTENSDHYAPLRRLVSPYILRRLKTDKSIIADLPDKTEMKVFCGLSPAQAELYQQTANGLAKALDTAKGMERRGLVLAYLMRFKQICNHPDQLVKAGAFDAAGSAKFQRLVLLCEEINERGGKALVFTQFREMTDPLEACLSKVFGRHGLILHGGTSVRERQNLVDQFQREQGPPFFVLSLKAGGTGLNLTAASHVIHFDRWWNPAVENQATDRAFRIGQKRNVLVHKFITTGTLEEKIDELITAKQKTADAILTGGAEKSLTEMSNAELMDFVRLDLSKTEN